MFSFFAYLFGGVWIAEHLDIVVGVIVLLIALIEWRHISKRRRRARLSQPVQQPEEVSPPAAVPQEALVAVSDSSAPSSIKAPASIDGAICVYHYEDVALLPLDSPASWVGVGSRLSFSAVNDRVEVYADSVLIGYVKPGRLSRMIYDWRDRDDPVWAALSSVDYKGHPLAFDLYLYRDEMNYLLRKNPHPKQYKLTGNRIGELQDNASMCAVGSECSISYDYEKEKYEVSDGWPIGYLPAAASDMIESADQDALRVFISDVTVDDADKTVISVYVFD